jgi:S-adenosylmethionine:tRNA ribosyltransferase-isomerase
VFLKTSDFEYALPVELIAQEPLDKRDSSRLLCLSRETGDVAHRLFSDLPALLRRGDRLIFNDTKVLPANMACFKDSGAKVEILFTRRIDDQTWQVIAKPAKRLKEGNTLHIAADPAVTLQVDSVLDDGSRVLSVKDGPCNNIEELLKNYGIMPLPPYIQREAREDDREKYQTVYAVKKGAVAAPTAGFHFTKSLLQKLNKEGIDFSFITLHVGIGTFRPVKEENPVNHRMHEETYELNRETVDEILKTQDQGGRVIAVGTTTVRVLEHCAVSSGLLQAGTGSTRLMILPGYTFNVINGLITNFHLPRSTLLMLVSAFTGRENILYAYQQAVKKRYRFFSYGDAMLIL